MVPSSWLCRFPGRRRFRKLHRRPYGTIYLGIMPRSLLSTLPRQLNGLSRCSTLWGKVHVQSLHTWNPHVGREAVSVHITHKSGILSHSAAFDIKPLPSGYHYTGPDSSHGSDPCMCNTVTYSLISACDACQDSQWITCGSSCFRRFFLYVSSMSFIRWADWIINCTDTQPPST